jgi:hypothetical protein
MRGEVTSCLHGLATNGDEPRIDTDEHGLTQWEMEAWRRSHPREDGV